MLSPRVYKGAPQTLLRSQRGLVISGCRGCLRTNHKIPLGGVEMKRPWAAVPFGRIVAGEMVSTFRVSLKEVHNRGFQWQQDLSWHHQPVVVVVVVVMFC